MLPGDVYSVVLQFGALHIVAHPRQSCCQASGLRIVLSTYNHVSYVHSRAARRRLLHAVHELHGGPNVPIPAVGRYQPHVAVGQH
jgi:hypothetical protein